MRLRERIGFFMRDSRGITGVILFLGTVLLCIAYCMSDAWVQERKELQAETEERLHTVSVPGEERLYLFYLYGEEGYLNVYDGEREEILIRTSIPVSSLPQKIQEEVSYGLGMKNEKELYGFLETYSS